MVGPKALRDAGAEVMELNGVRVVASTWLGSDRGTITVNGTPITAPYVLKVIGDPHSLEEGARFRGGLVSRLQAPEIGARVNIAQAPRILVESLYSPRPPQWARPA